MPYQREILAKVFQRGIKKLEINYSGENDSGGVDDVFMIKPKKKDKLYKIETDFLKEIGEEILELECDGFEVDGGANGVIKITLKEDGSLDYEVNHTAKFVEYSEDTFEGTL